MMRAVSRAPGLFCSNFRGRTVSNALSRGPFSSSSQAYSMSKDDKKSDIGDQTPSSKYKALSKLKKPACIVGGGALLVIATPLAVTAAGFTSPGIAAGSLAAKMMGTPALASVVPLLQSIGAAGLGPSGTVICGGTGGFLGAKMHDAYYFMKRKMDKSDSDDGNEDGSGSGKHKLKSKL